MKDLFKNLPNWYTDRLILRKIEKNDIDDLFICLSNENVTKFNFTDFDTTKEVAQKILDSMINSYKNNKATPWIIALRDSNKLIGMCGFSEYDKKNKKAEVGYLLNYDYWNSGVTTEALEEVITFGFKTMNLNKVQARCISGNIASENVMIKSGMKLDGILRSEKFYKGEFLDVKLYSILKCEKYNF